MSTYVEQDYIRFKEIVKGNIRKNLKKYITRGEFIGRKGKDTVKVPLDQIQIPKFRFGSNEGSGVGQGEGEEGDPVAGQPQEGGEGGRKAGDTPGEHELETEISLEELAEILGEELQLPRIQPKGMAKVVAPSAKYSGIRRTGPESLRHFKRTFKAALKRQISSGTYDYENPIIIPIKEDKFYKSFKEEMQPQYNALIIYIMDVSGSMGDEQKELVRLTAFWIDTWIRYNYKGVDSKYIIHDADAHVVDEERFYHTRESGGTLISSAYYKAIEILEQEYPSEEWNVYIFQFSDGDNWSGDDTAKCIELLKTKLLPRINLMGYGQVKSFFGSGQYINDLREKLPDAENLILTEIPDKDAILDAIKAFLGRGV